MHAVVCPLSAEDLTHAVYRHVELVRNGVRHELLHPGVDDDLDRRIRELSASDIAAAMRQFGNIGLPRRLSVLKRVHEEHREHSPSLYVAAVVEAVHAVLHVDDDCVLCDLVLPGLVLTLFTEFLGFDIGDRRRIGTPETGFYCKVDGRTVAFAKLIAQAWRGSSQGSVRGAPLSSYAEETRIEVEVEVWHAVGPTPRARIVWRVWLLAPHLRDAVDRLVREVRALVRRGRSQKRAEALALRRLKRRVKRRAPDDVDQLWSELLNDRIEIECGRFSGFRDPRADAAGWWPVPVSFRSPRPASMRQHRVGQWYGRS